MGRGGSPSWRFKSIVKGLLKEPILYSHPNLSKTMTYIEINFQASIIHQ